MKTKVLLAAALCIVAAVIIFIGVNHPQPASPAAQLAADLYPLYPGAQWGVPQPQQMTLGTTFSGTGVAAAPVTNATDLSGVSQPFEAYYAAKLAAAGWSVDEALQADGPGSDMTVYRKGSGVVVVRYASVFKNTPANEPEQCPCDITLSLFSSAQ